MSPEETQPRESWRPQRETKAQRAWQPGQKKPRRSIMVMFTSTVLLGEAFVLAFFGLMLYGLHQDDGGLWYLLGSLVLAVVAAATSRLVKKPVGITIGWILQVLLIASGFLQPFGFLVGIAFTLAWWYAVVKGKQLDQENSERDKQQEQWEREHGTAATDD